MDPNLIVTLGLTAIDEVISLIKSIKGQSGLSTEEIATLADKQDLQNKDDIKALLAL